MLTSILTMIREMLLLTGYLSSKKSYPEPLSAAEEQEYVDRYERGDMDARNKLIEHNLRLAAHIAKKYASPNRELEDLISTGMLGLIKAVNTYKRAKGSSLAAYAAKCIENAILS
ncbi:MAG: sigma-70 family RNA polymerase sigma factor [Clostridia bacterium]|nr:sigma-70 family RNA polymerase sigma factor [Clostridia bacterium]